MTQTPQPQLVSAHQPVSWLTYVWIAGYAISVLLANIAIDNFIPFPVYGELSIGTIFFAFIFTLRDRVHSYGLKYVFIAIALALVVTVGYSVAYEVPPRFIIASFLSIAVGELADTVVFQQLKRNNWLLRSLSSNLVSVPLDAFLFTFLAFYGEEGYPTERLWGFIYADVVVKYAIAAIVALPIYYTARRVLDQKVRQLVLA